MSGLSHLAYPVIMGLALAVAYALSRVTQRDGGLRRGERRAVGVGAFVGAMLGAKLPFVLADGPGLLSGAAWFSDGKTILTGLVGGYVGVVVAKWALEIKTRTGDGFAVPVAAAIAIGRLACFSIGCCYGAPTTAPWAVVFPRVDELPRHPTQLYEAAFHTVAAAVLWRLQTRGRLPGQLIKLYIIVYAGYRFVSETIRPEPRMVAGLTAYQWGSAALAIVFFVLWRRDVAREGGR